VDLDIHEGEFFFLLGPSGCGKTTLLRIISGLLEADEGQILLKNTDITRLPAHKRDVNTVFQNYALFPHMNVFDNVAFGLRMKKINETKVRLKVTEALKLVDLPDFSLRMPSQMSGGQMQRVALARAIVNEPAVLLLDEPLGALDVKLRRQMQLELRHLQRKLGTTFICVTHDQEEALTLGDRIAVMNQGRFEQIDNAHNLYHQPNSLFVCDFLGDCNFLSGIITGNHGQLISVNYNGAQIQGYIRTTLSGPKVTIGVRPEKIRVSLIDNNAPAQISGSYAANQLPESGQSASLNRLKATLTEIVFTGNLYTLVCTDDAGTSLKVSLPNSGLTPLPEMGTRLDLSWSIEDSMVLNPASPLHPTPSEASSLEAARHTSGTFVMEPSEAVSLLATSSRNSQTHTKATHRASTNNQDSLPS
jgi:spermidine/putrescine transport system ATP-binding protein